MRYLDARNPLPFNSETFDAVYSEHNLEHLPFRDGWKLCNECFRILKPGGIFRVVVPDLDFYIKCVTNPDDSDVRMYLEWYLPRFFKDAPDGDGAYAINGLFYGFGHRFIYNFSSLKTQLSGAGFLQITKRDVGHSQYKFMRGVEGRDKNDRAIFNKLESLVVECIKPLNSTETT